MKEYASEDLRNIAVVGHSRTGKTSILEACLYESGATKRLGRTDDGTGLLDYEPEESSRHQTISSKVVAVEWKGSKVNFIDTPGYLDVAGDVRSALMAVDSALFVLSAASEVPLDMEQSWQIAEEMELPRAFVINKMDHEHANFQGVLDELRVRFGDGVVPIQVPIGSEAAFQGVADALKLHAQVKMHDDDSAKVAIPEYMEPVVEEARQLLIEAAAEFNDSLLEKYVNGDDIDEAELMKAVADGIKACKIFPVFCVSAAADIGIRRLMYRLIEYMPSPVEHIAIGTDLDTGDVLERKPDDPFSAQVFKTIADPFTGRQSFMRVFSGDMKGETTYCNTRTGKQERVGILFTMQGKHQHNLSEVHAGDIIGVAKLQNTLTGDTLCTDAAKISYELPAYPESMLIMAVKAKKKGDEEKVFTAIEKEHDQDPTISIGRDKDTQDILVRCVGETHFAVLKDRIERKYGAEPVFSEPHIPYLETITKSVKAEGKHKKQSGGHGQYGHVFLELTPLPAGSGIEFTESIFGGSVPRQYIPAVEKGVKETLENGITEHIPVTDVKINLYDGSYHPVDSSEAAFKTATALALKKGIPEAQPVLLEPIWDISIIVPEYFMGDVMGQLNSKRARIQGMEQKGRGISEIQAQIPAAELYGYATDLRSQTKGRGSFTVKFSHYEKMQHDLAVKVIEARKGESGDK